MKCIECKNAEMRRSTDHVKQFVVLCNAEKVSHDFKSLTFERQCKSFKRLDQGQIDERIKWHAGQHKKLKSDLLNADRVYRQQMKIKGRK